MNISHLGISYFRSIGEAAVTLDLTKKINVLVGANNCGKSNVLRALDHLNGKQKKSTYTDADYHDLLKTKEPTFLFSGVIKMPNNGQLPAWFSFVLQGSSPSPTIAFWDDWDQNAMDRFMREFKGHGIGQWLDKSDLQGYKRSRAAEIVGPALRGLSPVLIIPQFRKIDASTSDYSVDGKGIVNRLAGWDRPNFGQRDDGKKLVQIRDLLRGLIQEPDAEICVSREKSEILVTVRDLQLPLESYGTGIHEIIILAIAVLSVEETIVCIEEPEIHLHPLLQRRFLEFLRTQTSNRYIITTHSPALIAPASDVAVSHLWLENGVTKSRSIATSVDSLRALDDLGAQASDLLQANSVIWVEGPSDRIYINRWIELLHPGKFREGIDYSIMFYGGRLLSHISLNRDQNVETPEDEAEELIQLLRINQHSALLIDSDRRRSGDQINPTKQRILKESKTSGVYCWISPGREIENCLPCAAISEVYKTQSHQPCELKLGRFELLEKALAKTFKKTWKRAHYYDHAKAQFSYLISEKIKADDLNTAVRDLVGNLVKIIEHRRR